MEVYIGDSRDIVVTQRKMLDRKIYIRYNSNRHVVLYDNEEQITTKIENFKDSEALLTLVQHIPGEWEMKRSTLKYSLKNANTLEYEIALAPNSEKELKFHYVRKNIR